MKKLLLTVLVAAAVGTPSSAIADDEIRSRFSLEAVQGILAVQRLDGWLLYDNQGQNRIAVELVNPAGRVSRRWFYLIPAKGQPIALVHKAEVANFDQVPGRKIEYTGHRDLKSGLRKMLKGVKRVSMEYAPKSTIPSLSKVDAGTVRLVTSVGVKIQSSAQLVQFTKSLWGPLGRIAHYVAVHHLTKLREGALQFVANKVKSGSRVTEYDVQQFIARGYKIRGIAGPPAMVATGVNTANPNYSPTATAHAQIRRGDLLVLSLSGGLAGAKRPIYAALTWVAYVGDQLPARVAGTFAVVADARDQTLAYIETRVARRRPVKGFQADQKARNVIGKAGHADKFLHRTGHSLDTSLYGDGANLDDYETHDTRNLVVGAGFTIEPAIYFKGEFGIRVAIDVFIGGRGVEVTCPVQKQITTLL